MANQDGGYNIGRAAGDKFTPILAPLNHPSIAIDDPSKAKIDDLQINSDRRRQPPLTAIRSTTTKQGSSREPPHSSKLQQQQLFTPYTAIAPKLPSNANIRVKKASTFGQQRFITPRNNSLHVKTAASDNMFSTTQTQMTDGDGLVSRNDNHNINRNVFKTNPPSPDRQR